MQREVFLEIKQKQRAKEMIGQDNILIVHCKRKTGNWKREKR